MANPSAETTIGTYGQGRISTSIDHLYPDVPNWRSRVRVNIILRNTSSFLSRNENNVTDFAISGSGAWFITNGNFYVPAYSTVTAYSVEFWVGHAANGTASVGFTGGIGATGTTTFGAGGSAYADRTLPSIATAPAAPTSKVPTNIKHTEMTFDIDDASNGGSEITGRYYKYSTASDFAGAVWIALPSNGTVVRDGLLPGTKYYFKAYVKNVVGDSSESTVRSATTLAGVYVMHEGVRWLGVAHGKYNDVWYPGVPYGKVSDIWTPATDIN